MRVALFQAALALALLPGCVLRQATEPAPKPAPAPAYHNPYNTPLSTPGARFGGLPQVVQNTVRSEAGTAEIVDVRKESRESKVFYKISFRDPRIFPPLYVAPDGSVLNPDLTVAVPAPQEVSQEVKLNDLPAGVKKVIQERRPGAEVASINEENWGNHTVYVVSFKDEAHQPKLHVVADGTVLIQPK